MAPATRLIEVFTAGCSICTDVLRLFTVLACPSSEVHTADMMTVDPTMEV